MFLGQPFHRRLRKHLGAERIGHLGWFQPRFADTLWPYTLKALRELAGKSAVAAAGA